jgi:polyisoprenoid-binding protein YceI
MSSINHNHRFTEAISGSWQLDPRRSSVQFRVGLFGGLTSVKGHFDDYDGRLDLSARPTVELTVNAASLQTGNRRRDRHLRSADFFDAEAHPEVRFVSDSVDLQGDTLRVRGRLYARDRSIPIDLVAQVRAVDGELEIEAGATVAQRELGMKLRALGTISARSDLSIKAHLIRDALSAAA